MRQHGSLAKDEEANAAASEAIKGAAIGAGRYALPSTLLSLAGQAMSPVYRGLTIQFKVFLVMSGMVLGGMIEGEHRLRRYEDYMRAQKRMERDQRAWKDWTVEFEESRRLEGERNTGESGGKAEGE